MGGSSFPTRQDPNSYPRGSALEDPTTLHQQSRIHILPRSWAAIVTPALVKPLLTHPYIQLCDNDPATHAINKGSGKHQPLNNLIGSHWAWHNRQQLTQILKRVPSKANIADPFSRRDFTIATGMDHITSTNRTSRTHHEQDSRKPIIRS